MKNQDKGQKITIGSAENPYLKAISEGVKIHGSCGGRGTCGKCKVKVLSGQVGETETDEKKALSPEELAGGWRLACRLKTLSNTEIYIPEDYIEVQRKSKDTILPKGFIAETGEGYGIAFDIGTTTVVGMLWDLEKGKELAVKAVSNPQGAFGADVISRIHFAGEDPKNQKHLHGKIISCLNGLIQELSEIASINKKAIRKITAVGNTTMCHLLLKEDPASLARAPFLPAYTGSRRLLPKELGIASGTECYVLPNIAGHVGADILAGILATGLQRKRKTVVLIDIGTNGEITLIHNRKLYSCSTAAGPAFEGAAIRFGMRAAEGAIEGVSIKRGLLNIKTIENKKPVGICGSGLLDAVAQLLNAGILDKKGRMLSRERAEETKLPGDLRERLLKWENMDCFYLGKSAEGKEIFLTQKDIREVQLAKGAIRAGLACLMKEAGCEEAEIDEILLAGAFGNYMDKRSAIRIGLLPRLPENRVLSVGNAAGTGASVVLLSEKERKKAEELVLKIQHVELSNHPDFQGEFLKAMAFDENGFKE